MITLNKFRFNKYQSSYRVVVDGVVLPRQTLEFIDYVEYDDKKLLKVKCLYDDRLSGEKFDYCSINYFHRKPKYTKGTKNHVGLVTLWFDAHYIKKWYEFWK